MKKIVLPLTFLFTCLTSFSQISGEVAPVTGIEYTYSYTFPLIIGGSVQFAVSPGSIMTATTNPNTIKVTFITNGPKTITANLYNSSGGLHNSLNLVVNVTGGPSGSPWTEVNSELYYTGNVGIGNTNPAYKLDISGATRISGDLIAAKMVDASSSGYYLDPASNSNLNTLDANYLDIRSGNGKGIRFWNSNYYKIHMGNSSEYRYGPVTDYSIKNNMNNAANRGWTWGASGSTPIAAINTQGKLQIKSDFTSEGNIYGKSVNSQYSNLYRFGGIYFTWDSDSYGTNIHHSIRSTDNNSYSDDLTMNSFGHLRFNFDSNSNGTNVFQIGHESTGTGNTLFHLNESGQLGLGTTSPVSGFKLDVNGNINARGLVSIGGATLPSSPAGVLYVDGASYFTDINVKAVNAWPDYVFSKTYKLRTLKETEEFIEENSHLPEVPSAKEIEEDGIDVAEMNTILLKKIEELTLHLIDQNKQLEELSDKVKSLESNK